MDLTPRLLTEVEFREEWRGYSRRDVDDFLERVAAAVGELQERLREQAERTTQAERRLVERSADDDDIRRTLVLAQRTAVTAVEEARAEAERIVHEAEERCRQQVAAAEARLAELDAELAERTRVELGGLSDQRSTLQADVDALRAFVDEHKARLRAELERQIASLDEPEPELEVPEPPQLSGLEVELPEAPEPQAADVPEAPEPEPVAWTAPPAPRPPTEEEVAQAREDLVEALRRAGVEDFLGGAVAAAPESHEEQAPEPEAVQEPVQPEPEVVEDDPTAEAEDEPEVAWAPEPEPEIAWASTDDEPAPQLYDAADESGEISVEQEPTGVYDALSDDVSDDDAWQPFEPSPVEPAPEQPTLLSADLEDDPFLAELRRAVTDTEPLGPRGDEALPDMGLTDEDDLPSARFRLRRGR